MPQIKELGGDVLVVSFTPPAAVAAYLERNPLPLLMVSDPTLVAYKVFALERTSWMGFFKPWVLFRFVKMMLRGWLPRKPGEGEDLLQLGGDFVLAHRRRLVYAHPSKDPTDRPSNQDLLRAVREAAAR